VNRRMNLTLRYGAVAAVTTIVGTVAATPAYAADDDVKVVNTETVQVYMSPTGKIDTERVYEQLAMTGNGTVTLKNPISTDNLRNLDGFGGFDVKNGEQITKTTVDGEKKLRSVSDFKGDLPLDVSVAYRLDGKNVKPGDVVGEDGRLEVEYTVKNVTGAPQEVSFPDGKGGTVTKTVEVPIPVVGSLSLVAPSSFKNVSSKQANIAGDGKGGTKLSFTMTLFPPIGSTTAVFGYTADITDGVVPRSEISALPVNPLEVPSFKSAGESYKGGADTGAELTAGATTIDTNLLKLRDGAADLLAGLIKLRDGAGELNAGLAGEAAPGSQKLANGAGELATGLGQINSGAKRLADGMGEAFAGSKTLDAGANKLSNGLGELDTGVGDLNAGANTLAGGQKALAAGLKDLYDGVDSLPEDVREKLKTNADYQRLLGTLDKLVAGIGTPADQTRATLLGGLNLLKFGIRSPLGVASCDQDPTDDTNRADDCGAADGNQIISEKLAAGVQTIDSKLLPSALGAYDALVATAGCAPRAGSNLGVLPPSSNLFLADTNPCKAAAVAAYGYGLPANALPAATGFGDGGLKAQATLASQKLAVIASGLTNEAIPGISAVQKALYNANCDPTQTDPTASNFCGVSQALSLVKAGVPQLVDALTANLRQELLAGIGTPTKGCDPEKTLRCAAAALADGGGELTDGIDTLVAGVTKLNTGGAQLAAGAGDLSAGLGQLDDGAGQLSDGAAEAADGSGQLATGADQLADGLKDAANGSGQLADGLGTAAGGAPKLVDGAQRLSDEGTKKLVEAGTATAQSYGEMYATMTAGAERANTEKMAFGAPEDAVGLTAYNYILKGDDGESGRNWARGLGGLAVLGAGAGVFALRRRFI
jgi:putative membrane protein